MHGCTRAPRVRSCARLHLCSERAPAPGCASVTPDPDDTAGIRSDATTRKFFPKYALHARSATAGYHRSRSLGHASVAAGATTSFTKS